MNKIMSLILLISISAKSEEQNGCATKPAKSELALLSIVDQKSKTIELEKLAKENNDHVIEFNVEPVKKTCSTVSYKFPEIKMSPNDSVYFHIPLELRERGVRFMVLGHRQLPGQDNVPGQWDDKPGLSSVQVHSQNGWSYWNGPSSGKNGAKFAEIRGDAEIENLYNWDTYGHVNLKTGEVSKEMLKPDAMKVTSVGTDSVLLSELTLKVSPMPETSKVEKIYSDGTAFTPENPNHKYTLGGGQKFKGKFPGAKEIYGAKTLNIPLRAGAKLTSVDVACGDSHSDGVQNSDGGWGTQGWAKLNIGIKKLDGSIRWMMNHENVPPEGVLMTSPEDCDEKIETGSELIISSDGDTTYVMGVHVGYR